MQTLTNLNVSNLIERFDQHIHLPQSMTCILESKTKSSVTGIPEVVSVVQVSGSLKQITRVLFY